MRQNGILFRFPASQLVAATLLLLLWSGLVAAEEIQERLPDAELLQALEAGGFVLFFRHGATDTSKPDAIPVVLEDCDTQRPLSATGRQDMINVGEALARADWPLREPIHVSLFCRARKSAELLFPDRTLSLEEDLRYTAALTQAEKAPVLARTRELLSAPVDNGLNRVVVAHAPNIAELMPYFPAEGALVILYPLSDGEFRYEATINVDDWDQVIQH